MGQMVSPLAILIQSDDCAELMRRRAPPLRNELVDQGKNDIT